MSFRLLGAALSVFHFSDFINVLIEGDPADEFGSEWVKAWMQTDNFRIFNKYTGSFPVNWYLTGRALTFTLDSHIFDIVEPNHPTTGGITIEDVQRRLTQCVLTP